MSFQFYDVVYRGGEINFDSLCCGFDTGQRHTKAIIKTVTDAPLPQYKGRSGISLLSLKNSDGHYLE